MLTGGQVHDASVAVDLLSELEIKGSNILGDKAYGSQKIRDDITEQKASYTIPPKKNCVNPWPCPGFRPFGFCLDLVGMIQEL